MPTAAFLLLQSQMSLVQVPAGASFSPKVAKSDGVLVIYEMGMPKVMEY